MKARILCIYALLPLLLTAGCSDELITEEPRPIIIPSKEDGLLPGQPYSEEGLPPPAGLDTSTMEITTLPTPHLQSAVSLEETFLNVESGGYYTDSPLAISDVSQLLWAGQVVVDEREQAVAAPVTINPLQFYLVVGDVTGLTSGSYLYIPSSHELAQIQSGDLRESIGIVTGDIEKCPLYIIIAAHIEKKTGNIVEIREKAVYVEGGQAAQNIILQASVLGLGTSTTSDFPAGQIKNSTGIPEDQEIIYIVSAGHIE